MTTSPKTGPKTGSKSDAGETFSSEGYSSEGLFSEESFSKGEASPSVQASPFLQANDDAFRQLTTFVDFAAEKLTIGFVSVNFPEDRVTIIEALQQHPDCQDVQFVHFEFNDPRLRFLQDELVAKLPEIKREQGKKLVLLLTGLEASIRMVGELGDYPPMLVDLNYVRDGFTTSVPHPIILFLPDRSLSRLAEFAPDFWAWRRAVIRFESLADDARSQVDRFFQRDNSARATKEERAAYAALDSRDRQDTIPRLLMEYESGSLAQDEDYKAFQAELMAELGISLYEEDSLDVAKDYLRRSLETEDWKDSKFSKHEIRFYLGRIERRQGNYETALAVFNESITQLELFHKHLSPWMNRLADIKSVRWLVRRYSKAFSELSCVVELRSEYIKVIAQRGETYRLMERYPESLTDFTRAIELDPEYKWVIAHRGTTYRLMERYPEALADFTHAIELDPEDKWAIALRGITYGLMERYPETLTDFTRAIELDPEDKGAIALRGTTYRLMERYSEALSDLTRAIELDPEDKGAIAHRGYTYRLMERYPEALTDFTRAIELDPEDKWAITSRGETYGLMERYPEAFADFTRAIQLDSEDERAIALRGITYRLMERYSEALTDLTRAIELDPEYEWAIAQRGQTHYLNHKYKQAHKDFNRAVELDSKDHWNVYERGKVDLLLGNYKQALQDFELSIELDPSNDWTFYVRSLAHTALKQTEDAKTDIEQAIDLAHKDYEANPQNFQNIFNLAIYHLTAGNVEQSNHLYQEALNKEPSTRLTREAIRDLEDLLTVLPNYSNAELMRSRLQSALGR